MLSFFDELQFVDPQYVGNGYPYYWNNVGTYLKNNNNGGWSNQNNYPFEGQANNQSYLAFFNTATPNCGTSTASFGYSASSYSPNSWTSTNGE